MRLYRLLRNLQIGSFKSISVLVPAIYLQNRTAEAIDALILSYTYSGQLSFAVMNY